MELDKNRPLAWGLGREPQSARGLGGVQGLSPCLGVGSAGVPVPCVWSFAYSAAHLGLGFLVKKRRSASLSPHVLRAGHSLCPRLTG